MALSLSIGAHLFRTRNAARDRKTDLDRLVLVRSGLQVALTSAMNEKIGLQNRLDLHCAQVASLLDNAPDYAERPADQEDEIAEAERQVTAVQQRIRQLEAQVEKLVRTLSEFEVPKEDSII